jgi:heptosyltransferase-1
VGENSVHLAANFPCSPCLNRTCHYQGESIVKPACYGTVTPERVFAALQTINL